MLESIVSQIKQKEEESNRKIMNARLKADSIIKMAEKKSNLLIKKYEDKMEKEKEGLIKQALDEAKKEIEKIKIEEKKRLVIEIKNAKKNEKKAIQFVKNYLCE
jgi:vacuolar-type H+-ATPase subunit H